MKKTSTSRRKKLPLLLGALLIISVAAYGTRAYFSDSATQQGNIALELGNVDITMDDTSEWIYTASSKAVNTNLIDANENKILENVGFSEASIKNVRPGDSFTRKFNVTNNGSLDVKLKVQEKFSSYNTTNLDSPFTVTLEGINDDILGTTSTTDRKEYTLKITVDTGIDDSYNTGNDVSYNKDFFDDLTLDYMNESLSVKAIQTNDVQ